MEKCEAICHCCMEAEFVACFEATVQANWLRNFISGLGVVDSIFKPLKIYCDNSATVFFSKNDKYSKGAKHMELKYFAVKEEVQKRNHVSTVIAHVHIVLLCHYHIMFQFSHIQCFISNSPGF